LSAVFNENLSFGPRDLLNGNAKVTINVDAHGTTVSTMFRHARMSIDARLARVLNSESNTQCEVDPDVSEISIVLDLQRTVDVHMIDQPQHWENS
jgi:hypothetical protein